MKRKTKDLVVKIDQRLAAEYRVAYQRAFGSAGQKEPSLTQAMEHFLVDRLREEVEFLQREMQ